MERKSRQIYTVSNCQFRVVHREEKSFLDLKPLKNVERIKYIANMMKFMKQRAIV